jgi:hypothetical protein
MYTINISIYTEQHNSVFVLLYYSTTCFGHWPSSGRYITKSYMAMLLYYFVIYLPDGGQWPKHVVE